MKINLDLAVRMGHAAVAEAARLDALVSAAVVDAGGHLVAFLRMDVGARSSRTSPARAPGPALGAVTPVGPGRRQGPP